MLRILLIFLSSLKGRTAGRTENLRAARRLTWAASWPGDSAGPACICPGPSLSRHGAVEEGHDLRPGAGRAGLKGSGSGALGHSALHGPGHRVRIVRTFRHVPEVMRPGCRGRALGPPQQHRRLSAGANPVRGKGSLGDAGGDALLHSPQNCPYSSSCRGSHP